jgi:hypothetical protein
LEFFLRETSSVWYNMGGFVGEEVAARVCLRDVRDE